MFPKYRLGLANVDLFIRGHKMRLHPYRVESLINLQDLLCGLDAYYRAFLWSVYATTAHMIIPMPNGMAERNATLAGAL